MVPQIGSSENRGLDRDRAVFLRVDNQLLYRLLGPVIPGLDPDLVVALPGLEYVYPAVVHPVIDPVRDIEAVNTSLNMVSCTLSTMGLAHAVN